MDAALRGKRTVSARHEAAPASWPGSAFRRRDARPSISARPGRRCEADRPPSHRGEVPAAAPRPTAPARYRQPRSANDTTPPSPTTKWSMRRTSTSLRASRSRPVKARSARLGSATPEGWLWYARISTAEGRQIRDRQLDALREAGCQRVYEERASGAAPDKRELSRCLDDLREGDVPVVPDLDGFGRKACNLITLIDELDPRDIAFRALNSPVDTSTPTGRAFLQISAAFAEMERNIIRQRVL